MFLIRVLDLTVCQKGLRVKQLLVQPASTISNNKTFQIGLPLPWPVSEIVAQSTSVGAGGHREDCAFNSGFDFDVRPLDSNTPHTYLNWLLSAYSIYWTHSLGELLVGTFETRESLRSGTHLSRLEGMVETVIYP